MVYFTLMKLYLGLFPVLLAAQSVQDLELGKATYRGNCAFCHGLTGRGGRGPNLASGQYQHGSSDADIRQVIREGVAGTTMPAFDLMESDELEKLIAYLRHLARGSPTTTPVAGDASKGRAVYLNNGCAACHRIGREGGLYGPELTRVGAGRAIEYIRESIENPSADIPDEFAGVTAVTTAGQRITGLRVNEDTFSLQLRDPSGNFRLFVKEELKSVDNEKKSLMPAYTNLAPGDFQNLLAYLHGLRGQIRPAGIVRNAEGR